MRLAVFPMPPNGLSLAASQDDSPERPLGPPSAADRVRLEALFVEQLSTIDSVIGCICRRHKVGGADAEDFAADVKLKIVERDYEVLRRFEGRSSLRTYLTVVISRMYLDYRNHLWGKWRPSAEARRLGAVAIRLETLMARDGLRFSEASRVLLDQERVDTTEAQLLDIACRLPMRIRRVMVGETALEDSTSPHRADEAALLAERRAVAARIGVALHVALADLPDQDRLILRLRFLEAMSIADIGRTLHLEAKPLYRRVETMLRALRIAIVSAGVNESDAHDLFGSHIMDINLALLAGREGDEAAPRRHA